MLSKCWGGRSRSAHVRDIWLWPLVSVAARYWKSLELWHLLCGVASLYRTPKLWCSWCALYIATEVWFLLRLSVVVVSRKLLELP